MILYERDQVKEALPLFSSQGVVPPVTPRTRYQGSKYKLLEWIWETIGELAFESVLDAFGGSGCVSHHLKGEGTTVTFNDVLQANYLGGLALVENDRERLGEEEIEFILKRQKNKRYEDLIFQTFHDIYFTDEENRWLDVVSQNIPCLEGKYKQALAYYGVFQAAIAKRPYNLFHRKNLYIRTAKVERSFGNKTTWDRGFEEHFRKYVQEANSAVFCTGKECRALNMDIMEVPGEYDLVYMDPPYMNEKGTSVDYHGFYHFLEGIVNYGEWLGNIDFNSKHRRLKRVQSPWNMPKEIVRAFDAAFERFSQSTIVLSYRTDGIPSEEELVTLMRKYKAEVRTVVLERAYQYVLSKNRKSREMLIIGTD